MFKHLSRAIALNFAFAGLAVAETELPFALDWKFEGPSAPYFSAIDNGHFDEQGLSVEIAAGQGSTNTIPKIATGAFPIGFTDINSLIKFVDQNPGAPIIGVMMVYDNPPFAIVGRKSLGVEGPGDLEGIVLGAPPPDGAWRQFPAFALANDIDVDKITVEPVGFDTREPMLAQGNVAAITGYSFSSYLNMVRLGVPEDDLSTILMAEHGLDLYGNVVVVNTDYAGENPDVVKGFVTAVAAGWRDAIADPDAAIASLIERNPAADSDLERRRLLMSIEDNVLTDYVAENGMGRIDAVRFASALEQLALTYEFQNTPDPALYFTDEYLPDPSSLMLK